MPTNTPRENTTTNRAMSSDAWALHERPRKAFQNLVGAIKS